MQPTVSQSVTGGLPKRCDVAIIGGGIAGSAAAFALARRGLAVVMVDPFERFPPWFRAEKVEPDQLELLKRLGLEEDVRACATPIHEVLHGLNGRVVHRRRVEQLGISYQNLVEAIRVQLPPSVERRFTRVQSVELVDGRRRLGLADGSTLDAHFCIVACGMLGAMPEQLGASKDVIHADLSIVFGFMLERADGSNFDFKSLTYRPNGSANTVGYITLFGMGPHMRVNVFAYWGAQNPLTREMVKSPIEVLTKFAPGLPRVIGNCLATGKVELYKIDLYRMRDLGLPALALIGDAYQSPCPSTGMGVSKVLTDVDVLCNEYLPRWLEKTSVGADDVMKFYADPRKTAVDDRAIRLALAGREAVMSRTVHWRLRRHFRTVRFISGL